MTALSINVDGQEVELSSENVIVERSEKEDLKVLNEGTLTVGLETKITPELKNEGFARDLVRGIQNQRKESGFEITDRITLKVSGDAELKEAFAAFKDFIANETLANSVEWVEGLSDGVKVEADEKAWTINIARV